MPKRKPHDLEAEDHSMEFEEAYALDQDALDRYDVGEYEFIARREDE